MFQWLTSLFSLRQFSIDSPVFGKLRKNKRDSFWTSEFFVLDYDESVSARIELRPKEESSSLIYIEKLWKKVVKKIPYLIEVTIEELAAQYKQPFLGELILRGVETDEKDAETLLLYFEIDTEDELKENMVVVRATVD
jgi:hypothetical protein